MRKQAKILMAYDESVSPGGVAMNETRILIGYDGKNPAARIINDLKRAGLPNDADVRVITVVEEILPGRKPRQVNPIIHKTTHKRIKKEMAEASRTIKRAVACFQKAFPSWKIKGKIRGGSPVTEIIEEARRWRSNLVIVGSHNQPRWIKFFLGSAAQGVIQSAPCAVRILRDTVKKGNKPVRIVIGVDGSRESRLAVEAVRNRKWVPGSAVYLVTALDNPISGAVFLTGSEVLKWIDYVDTREETWIHRMSASFEGKLRAAGLKVSITVSIGDPKQLLISEAKRRNADCIFVGARGLNPVDRFVMGSVSSSVAARAHCSVEVVR